jgi:hypothetical protein
MYPRAEGCRIEISVLYLQSDAGIAQLVEHDLAKVGVAGPSPVSRSKTNGKEGVRRAILFFHEAFLTIFTTLRDGLFRHPDMNE